MRYMMLIKATKDYEAGILPDEKVLLEMAGVFEALVKAGAHPECGRLQPSSNGTRVRYAKGKISVTDGPFAETKELIAGFCMIQVKSLVEAIEWARRMPFQDGEIEVRPLFELTDFPVDPGEKPGSWREKEEQFRQSFPGRDERSSGPRRFEQAHQCAASACGTVRTQSQLDCGGGTKRPSDNRSKRPSEAPS
jgi:hypothetical protein